MNMRRKMVEGEGNGYHGWAGDSANASPVLWNHLWLIEVNIFFGVSRLQFLSLSAASTEVQKMSNLLDIQ